MKFQQHNCYLFWHLSIKLSPYAIKNIWCLVCCCVKDRHLTFHSNFTLTSSYPERIQFNFSAILKTNQHQQAKILRLMAASSFRIKIHNLLIIYNHEIGHVFLKVKSITPWIPGGNRLNGYYPLPPEGHHIKHRQ